VNVDGPSWHSPWARRTAVAVKAIVIVGVVASRSMEFYHEHGLVIAGRPALYGVFSVRQMVREGREVAAAEPARWNWIAIDGRGVAIGSRDASWDRRRADFDDGRQNITLWGERQTKHTLTYSQDGDEVIMTGTLDGQQTTVILRRMPEPRFALQDPTQGR
jgi:hypothetical protein